jgi:hypothetical protein
MGRNEIRLRRNIMSSGRIAQHRNYGEVMARHEKEVRIKRIRRVFMYFLIILFMIVVFMIFRQVQRSQGKPDTKGTVSVILPHSHPKGNS